MATHGKSVRIKASGAAVAFTNEATTDAGDHKTYQVTNAARRVLDPQLAVVVQRSTDAGSTWGAAVGAYTLNRLSGTVLFAVALGASDQVRLASGSYLPMSVVAKATAYSLKVTGTNAEDTSFGDADITRQQAQRTCSGSLKVWWVDNAFSDALDAGLPLVIERASADGATPVWRAWALLSERSHEAAMAGNQEEPLTWEGTADADNRTYTNL